MSVNNFNDLIDHVGHKIVIATYGGRVKIHNVAIECEDCNQVILDYDNPDLSESGADKYK